MPPDPENFESPDDFYDEDAEDAPEHDPVDDVGNGGVDF